MNVFKRKKEKAEQEKSQKEASKKGKSETERKNGYMDDERETYRKGKKRMKEKK